MERIREHDEQIESSADRARELVQETIEEQRGATLQQFARVLTEETQNDQAVRAELGDYMDALTSETPNAVIADLPSGVGGQYDGGITVATDMLRSDPTQTDSAARIEQIARHEAYHSDHDHLKELRGVARGGILAVIGEEAFTNEELIEGLTVTQTGDTYVSADYRQKAERFQSAIAKAGKSVTDIENAIDAGDLTSVDDEARANDHQFALAA